MSLVVMVHPVCKGQLCKINSNSLAENFFHHILLKKLIARFESDYLNLFKEMEYQIILINYMYIYICMKLKFIIIIILYIVLEFN